VRENILIYSFTESANFLLNVIFLTSFFSFLFDLFGQSSREYMEVQIERENSINR
jgi:hypothetical protein